MRSYLYLTAPIIAAACWLVSVPARAEGDVFNISDPTHRAECGGCHVAYPPQLLPKASWQTLLGQLERHFGSDASVDAATLKKLEAYVLAHAGRERDARAKPTLRITETRWFRREHDEVAASVWKSAAVKSPANCGACHAQAEQGDFSERTLRVPR